MVGIGCGYVCRWPVSQNESSLDQRQRDRAFGRYNRTSSSAYPDRDGAQTTQSTESHGSSPDRSAADRRADPATAQPAQPARPTKALRPAPTATEGMVCSASVNIRSNMVSVGANRRRLVRYRIWPLCPPAFLSRPAEQAVTGESDRHCLS